MKSDTWGYLEAEICENLFDSLCTDVTDTVLQFRMHQEKQLQQFNLRIEKMLSKQKESMKQLVHRVKTQNKLSGGATRPVDTDHNTKRVRQVVPEELEMTPLASSGELPVGEPAPSPKGDFSMFRTITKGTHLHGPTTEQIVKIYRMSFLGERNRFFYKRVNSHCLARLVRTRIFALVTAMLIVVNAMFVGAYSHHNVINTMEAFYRHDGNHQLNILVEKPAWASHVELFFTIAFTVEFLLRLIAEEISFFCEADWAWNVLDMLLVIASLTELSMSLTGTNSKNVNSIRLLRLLRLLRTFRSVRILRFLGLFSKFRLLALAIQNSVVPFFWACAMVLWMLYLVSVVFLHGVTDHVASGMADATEVGQLGKLFGRLDCAVLTLFMTITGGMDWDEVFYALHHISVAYAFLLVFFIAVMTLAALNIIAGIFVNDAIEMAQMDRDIVLQTEMEKNRVMVKELSMLFTEFDTDKTGTLTLDELTEAWNDPEVSARFRMLGVEQMDAAALFRTLNADGSDEIDIRDFVTGCLRAKTLTKPVDFQTFIRESRRTAQMYNDHLKHFAQKLDMLSQGHAGPSRAHSLSSELSRVDERAVRLKLSRDEEEEEDESLVFPGLDEQCGGFASLSRGQNPLQPFAPPNSRSPGARSPLLTK